MTSMKSADRVTALVLVGLGIALCWGGFVMDRLEVRQIHPASIPGLVPMGLGVLSVICGGLLWMQTRYASSDLKVDWGNINKLVWAGALCLVFATLLVGNVSFFIASFVFITSFTARFTWSSDATGAERARKLAFAVVLGLVFAGLISALFQYLFLVRLP